MTKRASIFAAATALAAAACATPASDGTGDGLTADDPRLGPEVDRICFERSINGWRTIDGDDDGVILRRGVSDEYRVEYTGPCRASDFRFAQTIGIVGRPAGGCLTRGDRLLVEGPGNFINRCLISDIYEWNEDASDDAGEDASGDENED